MREQQERRRVQAALEFQRVLLKEIGELPLLEECDLSGTRSVLEIGCGGGEWLRAMAQRYPDLQCIGIEQNASLVKAANALAYRDGLPQAGFLGRSILSADYPRPALLCVGQVGRCAGWKPNCR